MKTALVVLLIVQFAHLAHSSAPPDSTVRSPNQTDQARPTLGEMVERLFLSYFGHPEVTADIKHAIARRVPAEGSVVVVESEVDRQKLIESLVRIMANEIVQEVSERLHPDVEKKRADETMKKLLDGIIVILSKSIQRSHDKVAEQVVDVARRHRTEALSKSANTTGGAVIRSVASKIIGEVEHIFVQEAKAGARAATKETRAAIQKTIYNLRPAQQQPGSPGPVVKVNGKQQAKH